MLKINKLYDIINSFTNESENSNLGKENANFIRCVSVMEHLVLSEINKQYLFDVIFRKIPLIKKLNEFGFLYQHQTSKLSPYCIGLSSYDIALKGLRSNATNERSSSPPKRIDTLLSQCANLMCLLSQEVTGATSVNDLSTVCAGFLYHLEKNLNQKISDYELKNYWQSFLYNINLPFRSGNSPFSNITLDFSKSTPTLENKTVVYAGKYLDFSYKDIPSEYFDRVNKAFINAMSQGDSLGNPFTFPLITINITDDFDYNNECWNYFLKESENFGGFYIQNYCTKPFDEKAREINPYHKPYDLGMLYSNCCRMIFDISELLDVAGSNPFASNSGVGGIGVITINLNRLLWLTQGDMNILDEFLELLLKVTAEALELKRAWLRKNWNSLYPYLSFYVKSDKSLFSIVSVCGMHEGLKSIGIEKGIFDQKGKDIAHSVAIKIRSKLDELSKEYKSTFSLEYAPIETAATVLAKKDLEFYDKLISERTNIINDFLIEDDFYSKKFIEILNKCLSKLES